MIFIPIFNIKKGETVVTLKEGATVRDLKEAISKLYGIAGSIHVTAVRKGFLSIVLSDADKIEDYLEEDTKIVWHEEESGDLYYYRTFRFSSIYNVDAIGEKTVLMGGLGTAGSWVLLPLTALGFRSFILLDSGVVDSYDVCRQPLYYAKDLGKNKVEAAMRIEEYGGLKVKISNIHVPTRARGGDVKEALENLVELVKECDIVISSFDEGDARLVLYVLSMLYGKAHVSVSLGENVSIILLSRNSEDACRWCTRGVEDIRKLWLEKAPCTRVSASIPLISAGVVAEVLARFYSGEQLEYNSWEVIIDLGGQISVRGRKMPRSEKCGVHKLLEEKDVIGELAKWLRGS